MGWTRNITIREQTSSPRFDSRFPSIERPVLSGSAIGFTKTISQYGVDFNFDNYVMYGQFVSGDYWDCDAGYGTEIVSISPDSQLSPEDGTTKINGAMLNPADSEGHGYDSRPGQDMYYNNAWNVDPGNTGINLVLTPGDTVVKSVSRELGVDRPVLTDTVMLTTVSTAPKIGSFRPAYNANTETIPANESDIDYTQLSSHALLGDTPDISTYNNLLARPWLEHNTEWTGREIRATRNQVDDYAAYFSDNLAEVALLLNMNFTDAEKRDVAIGMIQYGLDIYSFVSSGSDYPCNGGQNLGRKLPLLIAGRMLNDANMLNYADAAQHFIYHEDQQTFYVSQSDVDLARYTGDGRPRDPYTAGMIGTAEWGEKHFSQPNRDGANWNAYYRSINNAVIWRTALAVNLMGAEAQWNWAPYFDYADRMYGIDESSGTSWAHSVWNEYKV